MDEERKTELLKIAEKVLSEEGQRDVEELIDLDEEDGAKNYLLGAVDRNLQEGDLSHEEAAAYYQSLQVNPARAERMRQNNTTGH